MVGIETFDFQDEVTSWLLNKTSIGLNKKILIQSPTGSGKTIIMIDYIDQYLNNFSNTIFVWLTPGDGGLVRQSKEKMDRFCPYRTTKELNDVLINGFEENDIVFINWEKLIREKNRALRESEKNNILEKIKVAKNRGVKFILIIDEEHRNNTDKSQIIIDAFDANYIIRISATTINDGNSEYYEVRETDVIEAGLITRTIHINDGIEEGLTVNNPRKFLIDLALAKRNEILKECIKYKTNYNPLLLIQFPNASPEIIKEVEGYLRDYGITYDNGKLAIWMDDKENNQHKNIENIEKNDGKQEVLFFKEATSTGWDCPRAKILIKLRAIKSEIFNLQVIGRIRRMPEQKQYDNEILDNAYLYTFDNEFKARVMETLGGSAVTIELVKLKDDEEIRNFRLNSEIKNEDSKYIGNLELYHYIDDYLRNKYNLSNNVNHNKILLQEKGYNFDTQIDTKLLRGTLIGMQQKEKDRKLHQLEIKSDVNTHKNGNDLRHSIDTIAKTSFLKYKIMRPILDRLFGANPLIRTKNILKLRKSDFYAFIINNENILKHDINEAISQHVERENIKIPETKEWKIPLEGKIKTNKRYNNTISPTKNVYCDLPNSCVRSEPEIAFEKYIEKDGNVKWWYKNGETNPNEYFEIVYTNLVGKEFLFYPDYILRTNDGEIWIIETKGGESKDGKSKNIDRYTANKYSGLRRYADWYNLKWGFVREKETDRELYISFAKQYVESMENDNWKLLKDIL